MAEKILFDGRRPFGDNLSKKSSEISKRFAKFVEVGLPRVAREGE